MTDKNKVIEIWKTGGVPPQHAKVGEVKEDSQVIGDFLGWLQENGYFICRWDDKKELFDSVFKTKTAELLQVNGDDLCRAWMYYQTPRAWKAMYGEQVPSVALLS